MPFNAESSRRYGLPYVNECPVDVEHHGLRSRSVQHPTGLARKPLGNMADGTAVELDRDQIRESARLELRALRKAAEGS